MSAVFLPGDVLPEKTVPSTLGSSRLLTLGPGLHYRPPSTVWATTAGFSIVDRRKSALWLENNGSGMKYIPTAGDLVVATIHHSSTDLFYASINSYTSLATLPLLAFEGASKKIRPLLSPGSLVYARVSVANKHMDPELECVHPSSGRSDGLGELKGGMVFEISLGMARRMMTKKGREDGGFVVLEEFAAKGMQFETATGNNGRLWVNSDSIKTILLIGRAVQEIDAKGYGRRQQVKLARDWMSSA